MESDSQTAVSSERLQSDENERIREEVRHSRAARTVRLRPSRWNRIKALATAASLQSRLDATPRDTRCPRLIFIIRISIQGQTPRGADMIFPGVGRVTHRGTPYHTSSRPPYSFRISAPSSPRSKIHRPESPSRHDRVPCRSCFGAQR